MNTSEVPKEALIYSWAKEMVMQSIQIQGADRP
jgi:hypothetical protein